MTSVHPDAQIAADVEIGPFAVIEAGAVLGAGCRVGAGAQLVGRVEIGAGTTIGRGAIIGAEPQDHSFDPATDSGVRLGENNTVRELVTIHRANGEGRWTEVGDRNFLMAGTHLGHDVQMGSDNVVANNCLLAGHVVVGDRTFLGGGSVFHQFIHLGDLCMTQGNSAISQDVPPYCTAYRLNRLAGLNAVGLRRAGFPPGLRTALKRAYHAAFLAGRPISEAVREQLEAPDLAPEVQTFLNAIAEPSRKGVCSPKRHTR